MINFLGKYVTSPIDGNTYCRKNGEFARHIASHGFSYQTLFEHFNGADAISWCRCGEKCAFLTATMSYRPTCGRKLCANKLSSEVKLARTDEQLDEFRHKYAASMSKYSDDENRDRLARRVSTCIENNVYTNSVHKREETCLERYGIRNVSMRCISPDARTKLMDRQWMYDRHIVDRLPIYAIGKMLNVGDRTVGIYLHSHGISTRSYQQPVWERELAQILNDAKITFYQNDKTITYPKHLDFYIPSKNLAIELCGVYWHSDKHPRITKWYHHSKLQLCKSHNIRLLTIYDDEWNDRRDVVVSTIKHLIGQSPSRTYARKTTLDSAISTTERKQFMEQHHIQGDGPGSVTLGLRDDTHQLVAVMTFINQGKGQFSLSRYASLNVVGGFTKLLSAFERTHDWTSIITFADLRWSEGSLYRTNGFVQESILDPDYSYVRNGKRIHKFNYRLKALKSMLSNFDPSQSETQNCENHGISRVWDCGKIRFRKINGT